jgi:hypothetical protein
MVSATHYVLVQSLYRGFPDPPEWELHVMDVAAGKTRLVGCLIAGL